MVAFTRLHLLLPTIIALAARASGSPSYKPYPGNEDGPAKAIYFLTNEEENGVVALPVQPDGTLAKGTITLTGGTGALHVDANGQPATPDGLSSQSSITVAGHYVFVVNAGSNTLSLLTIHPEDPTKLKIVGEPAHLPGDFPNTVAVSFENKLVCVGLTGARSGISCGSFHHHGLGTFDELRPFDLGQTTPPSGPPNTVSQTLFSDDESLLITLVKGNMATNSTGFVSVYPVEDSHTKGNKAKSVSKTGTRSSPDGTMTLFGSQVIPGTSKVFVTDPSFGATILSVDSSTYTSQSIFRTKIEGQMATCWLAISPSTHTAFVADGAVNRLVELSLKDASVVSILDLPGDDQGLFDMKAAGNFIYALAPNNGTIEAAVNVVDVSGGPGSAKQIQHFGLGGIAGDRAQGLAAFF
ncbi:hypothetical protein FSARC_12558 [Fusarium sarcochroum]|uniref:3-carboxymuconate cyclase n=1 Tax=Fusarium sarcochroum TaxID=1208366 RepID=A0A8H4WWY8_9HYPO|nr:hypothetical protein FSARC_12558 [Fusarium sarcochroum]